MFAKNVTTHFTTITINKQTKAKPGYSHMLLGSFPTLYTLAILYHNITTCTFKVVTI